MAQADSDNSTNNVVQFSAFAAAKLAKTKPSSFGEGALSEYRAAKIAKREARLAEVPTAPETLTETCKNQRLRLSRRDIWWAANRTTNYWRASLDWHSALAIAQEYNVADANSHPKHASMGEDRAEMVYQWRTALVKQMLTPAPDLAAVAWKRAHLRADHFRYTHVKPERFQSVIDADVEWLNAHPTKKSRKAAGTS